MDGVHLEITAKADLRNDLLALQPLDATLVGDVVRTGIPPCALELWRRGGYEPAAGCNHPLPPSVTPDELSTIYLVVVHRGSSGWAAIRTARGPRPGECAVARVKGRTVLGTFEAAEGVSQLRLPDSAVVGLAGGSWVYPVVAREWVRYD